MTNADKFKSIFGLYATELWAKPEKDFLEWLNADNELFGNSEQLEKDHFADPGNMVGDTISRQVAITLFEKYGATEDAIALLASLPSAQPTDEDIQRMQDIEQAMLEKAYWFGKQDAQEWIPCSERLPEIKEHHVSDTVICYCSNGAYAFSRLEENIFGQCGFECERDDDYYEAVGEVVAWMPLPEPWKGGPDEYKKPE